MSDLNLNIDVDDSVIEVPVLLTKSELGWLCNTMARETELLRKHVPSNNFKDTAQYKDQAITNMESLHRKFVIAYEASPWKNV